MSRFAVVLLAAGGSSRFGSPKQLLPYLGRTLIEHAADVAIASGAAEIIVVLGSEAITIQARLQDLPVRIVTNPNWQEGLGSSIRRGIAAVGAETQSVVIALADQPHVTPAHLRALGESAEDPDQPIAASSYGTTLGAPCAFHRSQFPGLQALKGDEGARALLRAGTVAVTAVPFPRATQDIDTPTDYAALVASPDAPEGR